MGWNEINCQALKKIKAFFLGIRGPFKLLILYKSFVMKKGRHFYYEELYIILYWDFGIWNKQNASAIVRDSFQTGFDLLKSYLRY